MPQQSDSRHSLEGKIASYKHIRRGHDSYVSLSDEKWATCESCDWNLSRKTHSSWLLRARWTAGGRSAIMIVWWWCILSAIKVSRHDVTFNPACFKVQRRLKTIPKIPLHACIEKLRFQQNLTSKTNQAFTQFSLRPTQKLSFRRLFLPTFE